MRPADLQRYSEECAASGGGWSGSYGLCCDEYESPNDFPSIFAAFWWCIVTMTTVGFGDVYPKTGAGRLVGMSAMLTGILLIALPVAIVGRQFQEVYDNHQAGLGEGKGLSQLLSEVSGGGVHSTKLPGALIADLERWPWGKLHGQQWHDPAAGPEEPLEEARKRQDPGGRSCPACAVFGRHGHASPRGGESERGAHKERAPGPEHKRGPP